MGWVLYKILDVGIWNCFGIGLDIFKLWVIENNKEGNVLGVLS